MLLDDAGTKLVSLFDGHGNNGHVVAHAAMLALPSLLLPNNKKAPMTSKFLSDVILKLDRTIPRVPGSGATSIVMVQQDSKLFVANLGDSFGFVAEYSDGVTKIIHQTKPHKPHLLEERQRIERAGGRILLPPGPGETSRVIIPVGSMELALAMSRSLGDVEGKDIGVLTALPTIDFIPLTGHPKRQLFAVAATDGLMDYLNFQDVANDLGRVLFGTTMSTKKKRLVDLCEQLVMQASEEWNTRLHGQYRDDISIVVTKL
jgi:serine/threonine protein phosphatase PrpC